MDALMVDVFLSSYSTEPKQIVLDIDATNDPLHGQQEGRYYHGYYRQYCYLPLHVFCGGHPLLARVRGADVQPATGCVQELEAIVRRIRERWPHVQIVVRGDSGFARDELMCWCEDNGDPRAPAESGGDRPPDRTAHRRVPQQHVSSARYLPSRL